jgi:hypothetical protein
MLMECVILREGPTPVIKQQTKYLFMPIPGTKPGEMSTSVTEVQNPEHIEHLKATGLYREYDQDRAMREAEERRKQKSKYSGYAIEKYMDAGYIVVDKKKKKFAGTDGWRDQRTGTYFKSEIEAYDFLREEVEYEEQPEPEVDPEPKKPGRKPAAKTQASSEEDDIEKTIGDLAKVK